MGGRTHRVAPTAAVSQGGDPPSAGGLACAARTRPIASPCQSSSNTQQDRNEVTSGSRWAGVTSRLRR